MGARLSTDDLLKAAGQLAARDLEHFVSEVNDLCAHRRAPRLPAAESRLLRRINNGFSEEFWQRYRRLQAKRRAEKLRAQEHADLIRLTDEIERKDVLRLRALAQLADIRGVTLSSLMKTLGIPPRAKRHA